MGSPPTPSDLVTENGLGAVYHHRFATWDRADIFVSAFEASLLETEPDGAVQSAVTIVTMQTRDFRLRESQLASSKPKPLD
jgi:hypothetical protein